MPELLDRLHSALSAAYRLEGELGGGGMSRVFLAEEMALGRRVVIKVLPDDLARGLSAERFRREVHVAAKLHHPHIVPLYAAGEADGLLYYTMPFIEGESLRAKLAREGELPISETVRLLRDAVDALCYAHEQGVVHRDIKPDNVMVSRQHALVTDFGVAKALSEAADASQHAGHGFTSAGVAMGTPAYMAPEQAAADPAIDHRADIYSIGVMAYEMLAGHPPFVGRSAQQLLAAHVGRAPEPLSAVRPTVGPELAEIVMRCLEKRPADRWQSADDLLRVLEAVATPGTGTVSTSAIRPPSHPPAATARPQRRWALFAGVTAAVVCGVFALRWTVLPGRSLVDRGVIKERERILISDFRSPPADSALGGAVTEAFRIDLAQSPKISVMQPEDLLQTLARMQRDPRVLLDAPLAREVAIRDGVKAFVTGDVVHAGTSFVISARLVSSESGDALISLRESANDSTRILPAIDRLSRAMRQRIGESLSTLKPNESLEQVSTSSLVALRKYSLALGANRQGDTERAIALLREAVALDSGFAMAYRKLGVVLSNTDGRRSEQVDAFTWAYEYRDRLTDRERYLTQAAYQGYVAGDREKALTAYRSLLDLYPTDTYALNNLSIGYIDLRNYAQGEDLARRAIAVAPDDPTFYMNLISAQIGLGRIDSAEQTLRIMRSKTPGDPYGEVIEAAFATLRGSYDSATARLKRVRETHRESPVWRSMASSQLAVLAATQGRLAEADDDLRDAAEAAQAQGQPETALLYEVGRAALDVWYRGRKDRAVGLTDSALARRPLSGFNPMDRPYLPLALFYAEAGRLDRARGLINEFDRVSSPGTRRLAEPFRHGVLGSIALAERRPRDAVAEYKLQDDGDCPICALGSLGRAYDAAGEPDSAIAAYERYLSTPFVFRMFSDAIWLARTYHRLGELYEERGKREKAAEYYAKFVRLWKDADPELKPEITEVKRRLEALTGERAVS